MSLPQCKVAERALKTFCTTQVRRNHGRSKSDPASMNRYVASCRSRIGKCISSSDHWSRSTPVPLADADDASYRARIASMVAIAREVFSVADLDDHRLDPGVDPAHEPHLARPLPEVLLVDAHGVRSQRPRPLFSSYTPQPPESRQQRGGR